MIRPMFVYVKTPITADQLKIGDIFSLDMAHPADIDVNPNELHILEKPVRPIEGKPGEFELDSNRLRKFYK